MEYIVRLGAVSSRHVEIRLEVVSTSLVGSRRRGFILKGLLLVFSVRHVLAFVLVRRRISVIALRIKCTIYCTRAVML